MKTLSASCISILQALTLLMLLQGASNAQTSAPSYADMRTWKLEGVAGGNWRDPLHLGTPFASAASGRSVFQTINNTAGTMFLVSNDTNVINRTVWGTVRIETRHTDLDGNCTPSCSTNESDNDWIGFAVGYRNETGSVQYPERYIGFTWNRDSGATSPYGLPTNGAAAEGIFLVRAAPPNGAGDPTGAGATIIKSDTGTGKGWRYNIDYQFRIVYTTNRIRVYINDVLRLEATAAQAGLTSFEAGQFGFTNASQANVLFGNVLEADASAIDSAPIASDDRFYYGLTWGTEGNVFDTDVDTRAAGVLDNDYDPDGDPFVLRVGSVSLPNDSDVTTIIGTQGGAFQVYGSGRVRYTAPTGYQSRGPFQDSFAYTIVDSDNSTSQPATVTVTVQQANSPPDDITLTDVDGTPQVRIDQGAEPGTVIATIATIENSPGELDAYDYELANASGGAFAVIGNQLVVRDTAALGGPQTRSIQIRSTDVEGQSVTRTFSVIIDPNALPTTANSSINAAAAVPFVFGTANFPYSDTDGDPLRKVLIMSLPSTGTLFLDLDNDNAVDPNEILQINFNDVVTQAQLTGGQLKYLSNSTTDTSTSFTFKVNDGAANSAGVSTMTINVDADSDNDGIPNATDGLNDTDGDGTPNYLDNDSDGDGIVDSAEGTSDTDGDGTPNYRDTDSDNDGLPDSAEGSGDTDADGTPDYRDVDSDGDGIPDASEGAGDADGDGTPNYRDTDSDNNGIPDSVEGVGDNDFDTIPDYLDNSNDEDGDGIPDIVERSGDSDGDGLPNALDVDSDNDGVPDVLEIPGTRADVDSDGIADRFDVDQTHGTDANGDGIDDAAAIADTDGDGRSDLLDPDQDGDGIPDALESGAYGFDSDNDGIDDRFDADTPGATDPDGDGIANNVPLLDTDADGIADMFDLDSDRDGVSDAAESGATRADGDSDGIDDAFDVDTAGGSDANGDGIRDGVKPLDTDGDGVPDFRDLDSDNDSLTDVSEAQRPDANQDGLLDQGGTITGSPVDTDGDSTPDLRDVDSNNDGRKDIAGTIYAPLDTNGDGRIDVPGSDVDADGIADAIDGEQGQRGTRVDNDGDGIPVEVDQDDDGDGIPDSVEGEGDADGDGTMDRLDRDSDNDGIPDRIERGLPAPTGIDSNRDGVDDAYPSPTASRDTDRDGIPDQLDPDSDNDGLTDAREILIAPLSGADSDGDGIDDSIDVDVTRGTDQNRDGVDDTRVRLADTDGDGLPDYLDPDSDDDGIADGKEDGDFNQDGINDRLQKTTGLKTGLKGGGGSFNWLALGLLSILSCVRTLRVGRSLLIVVASMLFVATPFTAAHAADGSDDACVTGEKFTDGCWSAGFGAYITRLRPDDSRSNWRVVDDSDAGYKLSVEYRFFDRWFLELGYADMGAATVINRNPLIEGREPVDYQVPSLLAGYLLLDPSSRWNIHVKAGYASLQTDAADTIIEEQIKSNQLTLGIGVRARLMKRLQLVAEYEYYDKDAQQAGLAVRYLF